jgi:prolyl-tRNA editing enzyme YbaK/EbsC (Cys-tRNA(Pro) deacylase)
MAEALIEHAAVRRVRAALAEGGSAAAVLVLDRTARSAEDAAAGIGSALGAIVKSLIFLIDDRPVMALVAGDRRCDTAALGVALGRPGKVRRADAEAVRAATGFAIGGVAPVAHPRPLPTAIDASLGRFQTIYAAAGHPHCVFPTSVAELQRMTGGTLADDLGV